MTQEEFVIADADRGRLKRAFDISTVVSVEESQGNLSDFPFDHAAIHLVFRSISHWRSRDESESGIVPRGAKYQLRTVSRAGEGVPFRFVLTPSITAWSFLGAQLSFKTALSPQGQLISTCTLALHVVRKPTHYFWKVTLPLLALTGFGLLTLLHKTDALSDRLDLAANMFLAAFAVLYVVNEELPKTDVLTCMDVVIIATLAMLLALAIASFVICHIHETMGELWAAVANRALASVLVAAYVILNLIAFLPAIRRRRRMLRELQAAELWR